MTAKPKITDITEHRAATADPDATTSLTPTMQFVDPTTLLVDTNVRLDPRLDADFTASVADLGVLVPVVAVRTSDGALRVRYGHRRTMAAAQANLPTIPVVVLGDEADGDTAEVARIVGQWHENERRTGFSLQDRVSAVAQLSAFGVSAAQIAKRTRLPRKDVDAALIVAGSELAQAATARFDFLDLVQAAVVADFGENAEAVKALVAAAKTGQFDHVAQRLRDDRDEQMARDAAARPLREAGITVVPRPEYGSKTTRLGNLTDDSDTREPLAPEAHAGCPGHAAYLSQTWVSAVDDAEDDVTVDQDQDLNDDEYRDMDDEDASDGHWEWLPVWVCTDPSENGHEPIWASSRSERTPIAEMSEEQRGAARAELRDVVESNKAWTSAETVRREWLRAFLARKTAPKTTATFLATAIAHDGALLSDIGGNHLAAELLGLPGVSYGRNVAFVEAAPQAGEARAQVIVLAQMLAAYEAHTDRSAWRTKRADTSRYLTFLAQIGYTLSAVEQRACL